MPFTSSSLPSCSCLTGLLCLLSRQPRIGLPHETCLFQGSLMPASKYHVLMFQGSRQRSWHDGSWGGSQANKASKSGQGSLSCLKAWMHRGGSLYGELARFVLRLLGFKDKSKDIALQPRGPPGSIGPPPGSNQCLVQLERETFKGRLQYICISASRRMQQIFCSQ